MENNKKSDWAEALAVFFRLSVWIVFPVLIGVFLGKWLDRVNNSSPKWFLIVVGISFVISMFGLVVNTLKEYKKIEKNEKKDGDNDNDK
jgi:F0F1-type ATP synthase assembly protein I